MNTVTSVANVVRGSLSLQQVHDKIEQDSRKNSDRMILPRDMRFNNGYMVDPSRSEPYPLTRHSALQLAALVGIPSRTFMWLKEFASPQEFTSIVNREWSNWAHEQKNPILFRLRQERENGPVHIRAILSSRYGMLDNLEFVKIMSDILIHNYSDPRFSHCHVDGKGMHLTLQLPLTDQVELGGNDPHRLGVSLGQNEIGNGRWYVEACATRAACLNLAIWTPMFSNKSSGVHIGDVTGKLRRELESTFRHVVRKLPDLFSTYMNTQTIDVVEPDKVLSQLVLPNKLMTQTEVEQVVNTKLPIYLAEMGSTAYALVNSLSEFARDMEDQERARVISTLAGTISQLPASKFQLQLA